LSKEPIGRIETGFAASPPIRQYWVQIQQGSKEILGCRSPPKDKSFYALNWLIQALCDERQLRLARLPYLMDELARTMEQDTGAKEPVHSWVANQISKLAVFAHCMHQVGLYQPWAATFASRMVDKKDEVEQDYADTLKMIDPYLKVPGPTNMVSLAILSDGNFDYPLARSRNRKNIEAMRLAEANLDSFYRSVWQLVPTKLDAERPIQFHEPHPGGKIPFTTARRHGRRLKRAYGWHREMFVPKQRGIARCCEMKAI
ncbi:hypothetical protein LTS18_005757, partial [Coniosporium uncinatum]